MPCGLTARAFDESVHIVGSCSFESFRDLIQSRQKVLQHNSKSLNTTTKGPLIKFRAIKFLKTIPKGANNFGLNIQAIRYCGKLSTRAQSDFAVIHPGHKALQQSCILSRESRKKITRPSIEYRKQTQKNSNY